MEGSEGGVGSSVGMHDCIKELLTRIGQDSRVLIPFEIYFWWTVLIVSASDAMARVRVVEGIRILFTTSLQLERISEGSGIGKITFELRIFG